jgi:hypothetical protein
MNSRTSLFLLIAVQCLLGVGLRAQREASVVTDAASVLVLGRLPTPAERERGVAETTLPLAVTRLRADLARDPALRDAVAAKAYVDAFGRKPQSGEAVTGGASSDAYIDLMKHHVASLAQNADTFADVIRRAYPLVIHRDVYPEEIAYWKKHGALPFCLVVAAVEDWARRNQPGLMVTAGKPMVSVNSDYLTTVRLSPALAAEARNLAGLAPVAATADAAAPAFHLIAAGGERLGTGGGIHFIAAGRPGLVE